MKEGRDVHARREEEEERTEYEGPHEGSPVTVLRR